MGNRHSMRAWVAAAAAAAAKKVCRKPKWDIPIATCLPRERCRYTQYYCEENVYHLCRENVLTSRTYVVFISSDYDKVAIRHQALRPKMTWDYHVICICESSPERFVVLDLDSKLPWAVSFDEYVQKSFESADNSSEEHVRDTRREPFSSLAEPTVSKCEPEPLFRVVLKKQFEEHFASDRSHMLPHLQCPAPPWQPIQTASGEVNTFPRFRSVKSSEQTLGLRASRTRMQWELRHANFGTVVTLAQLKVLFGAKLERP